MDLHEVTTCNLAGNLTQMTKYVHSGSFLLKSTQYNTITPCWVLSQFWEIVVSISLFKELAKNLHSLLFCEQSPKSGTSHFLEGFWSLKYKLETKNRDVPQYQFCSFFNIVQKSTKQDHLKDCFTRKTWCSF